MTNEPDELDDLLDERRLPTKDVPICLDLTLIAARDRAMSEVARSAKALDDAKRPDPDAPMAGGSLASAKRALDKANAAVADLEKQIREKSFVIQITGVDRTAYNRLLLECPPRPGHRETFDPTKFYMHAASKTAKFVSKLDGSLKDISAKQWERIDKTITDGEHERIAAAVIEVNRAVGGMDVGFFGSDSDTTTDSAETSD